MATICPLVAARERDIATEWVRAAISSGKFDRADWRNGFPRKIWHRDGDGRLWYGFLTNQGSGPDPTGQYKGWPME